MQQDNKLSMRTSSSGRTGNVYQSMLTQGIKEKYQYNFFDLYFKGVSKKSNIEQVGRNEDQVQELKQEFFEKRIQKSLSHLKILLLLGTLFILIQGLLYYTANQENTARVRSNQLNQSQIIIEEEIEHFKTTRDIIILTRVFISFINAFFAFNVSRFVNSNANTSRIIYFLACSVSSIFLYVEFQIFLSKHFELRESFLFQALQFCIIHEIFSFCVHISMLFKILSLCIQLGIVLAIQFSNTIEVIDQQYLYIFYLITIGFLQLFVSLVSEWLQFNKFISHQIKDKKQQYQEILLRYLLPTHIRQNFMMNNFKAEELVETHEDCTLLFADIAGFTAYSGSVEPHDVVKMVSALFTDFDKYCLIYNVFQLYTIGDCYVIMGFTDKQFRDPPQQAANVIDMAFQMIQIIGTVREQINFPQLDMRIGVHTGKIIGSMIGTDIIRYDIYGINVLIANQMESNGEKGQVTVSQVTKELLEGQFPGRYSFTFKESVFIKSSQISVGCYLIKKLV